MMKALALVVIWLGFSTIVTAQPELDKNAEKKLDNAMIQAFGNSSYALSLFNDSLSLYKVDTNGVRSGFCLIGKAKGRYDYFDYAVIYSTEWIIHAVEILNYRSDHGYEITNRRWLANSKEAVAAA